MGFRQLINNAVASAFNAVGDLAEDAVLLREETRSLNPAALKVETETVEYAVKVMRSSFNRNEIDGEAVLPDDVRFVVNGTGLPFTPTNNDKIVHAGTTYDIVRVSTGAVPAAYVLQARHA